MTDLKELIERVEMATEAHLKKLRSECGLIGDCSLDDNDCTCSDVELDRRYMASLHPAPEPVAVEAGLVDLLLAECAARDAAPDEHDEELTAAIRQAASALSSLQEQVEALTHEVGSAGSLRLRMEAHRQTAQAVLAEVTRLRQRVAEYDAALAKIEKWHGEFPPSDRHWPDGTEMSYGAAFGSNGERDFMREIARRTRTKESNNV